MKKILLSVLSITAFISAVVANGEENVSRCEAEIDATRGGVELWNAMKMMNTWNCFNSAFDSAHNRRDSDRYEFVEWFELMQCTGGNDSRDLFKNPNDMKVKDDYDFTKIIASIRGLLNLGAKPYIKLGNVPKKFVGHFDGGEFSINIYPPEDWDGHNRYIAAFMRALVDAFGVDEVRSWRYALLTEADNAGWFFARSKNLKETFDAYCRLYKETYLTLRSILGEKFLYGTHVLGATYDTWKLPRWTAEQFCKWCAAEKLPLDIIATSHYNVVGYPVGKRLGLLEDTAMGDWMKAAKKYGFKNVIWGVDEGRIIVGRRGRDRKDLLARAHGDAYQAAWDARITKNMYDLGVDYFAAWQYFTDDAKAGFAGPAHIAYYVAREAAKFKGMKRADFKVANSKFVDKFEEFDGVASVSADGRSFRVMAYHFNNKTKYSRLAEAKFAVKTALPPLTRCRVRKITIDNDSNWYDDWDADRVKYGIKDSDFTWSPDCPCVLSFKGLVKQEHRELFKKLLPKYLKKSVLVTEERVEYVDERGIVELDADFKGNAVVFFDIQTSAK